METEQTCPESTEKVQQTKPLSKHNQKKKKKSVAGNQSLPSGIGSAKNTKLQKPKGGGVASVPKQGSKGPSAAKKSKEKRENNQSINKEDSSNDVPTKQNRKKNKKSADVTQKPNPAVLAGKSVDTERRAGNTKEVGNKKGPFDQKGVEPGHVDSKEGKQKALNEETIKKSGTELSKSKKRRIRKRRLLESLGINIINSVNSTKDKSTTKKRKKKKKAKYTENSDIFTNEPPHKDSTAVKSVNDISEINGSVISRSKESSCDIVGKKDTANFTPKLKDPHHKKPPEQVTKAKETKLEKKIFADTVPEVKEVNNTPDSNTTVKLCSSCEDLKFNRELPLSDNKTPLEDISLQFLSKKEEPSPSGRVDLVNFLSHDNVEGLFRSALLNDVTLSSRCSEKEVKNFFNTYGTFSERGRTQFAAVEKLLHSSSKDSEDIATSQYFEPALDKEISPSLTPQKSTAIINKESSLDSSSSALALVGSPKCEYFSLKRTKDNSNADEPGTISSVGNFETDTSCNQVGRGLNRIDSVGNSLVFKGSLCRGPIYTSPNLENKVTSSANSNQILNSTNRFFVPNTYDSCDIKQDSFNSCEVSEVQRLDSKLVDGDNDLSVKEHFLQGDKTQPTEVCNVSELSLTCGISSHLEDSSKEQAFDNSTTVKVNTVECQVDLICKNNEVNECRGTEESHPLVNSECSKEQIPICTRLNKNIRTAREKEDSEKLPDTIQKDSGVEKYRWTGFVSESGEDIYDTGSKLSKTAERVIPLTKVEKGQTPDNFSHTSTLEVSCSDHKCNTRTDFQTDSSRKELETLPTCSNVTEVSDSEIVKSSPNPLPQNKVIMKLSQGKPVESREEILAAREAKKAEKLAKKGLPAPSKSAAENVSVLKKQTTTSPSKNRQQSKSATDAGKSETEHLPKSESVSKNNIQCPDVKELSSPLRDSSHQKSKVENKAPKKRAEVKEKEDELPEIQNKFPTGSSKEDEASGITEILGEKMKENGGGSQSVTVPPVLKSKAELRAERRAKQEQQRAVKAAQHQSKVPQEKSAAIVAAQPRKNAGDDVNKKLVKTTVQIAKLKTSEHRVKLFNHLYHERGPLALTENLMLYGPDLHPAVVKLGIQYADRVVVGSNARCIALLDALKQVIRDYETPLQKEFSRGLEAELQPSVAFLDCCRPLSVSMTNALRHLMWQLTQLPNNVSDSEAKKKLLEAIDTYIREQIEVAAQAICIMVQRKIANGDVILTYGCSSLLQRILLEAHRSGTKFRVVVVDGRPWREGQEMLRRLVECGLDCSYVLVSAASFIMREVTKVFLGAHALLANGYVMSRAGSSQVALLAHSYNVPVLVCCETHKFCERVQTDSFVYNELGNPDDLIPTDSRSKECPLSKWRSIGSLTPLNLTYDVTPPDLVTAVVTELAILPCTSVPVILRIKPTETGC